MARLSPVLRGLLLTVLIVFAAKPSAVLAQGYPCDYFSLFGCFLWVAQQAAGPCGGPSHSVCWSFAPWEGEPDVCFCNVVCNCSE